MPRRATYAETRALGLNPNRKYYVMVTHRNGMSSRMGPYTSIEAREFAKQLRAAGGGAKISIYRG